MLKTVYFVPAPDMDERTILAMELEGCRVIPLILAPFSKETGLEEYARGLIAQIPEPRPTLVGGCYGGPLALEIARRIEVERVVLVACIKDRSELTVRWRLLFHAYLLLPTWLERAMGVSLSFFINRILRIPIKIPRLWRKSAQNKFIARHLLSLQGVDTKLIHIHGDRDAIFPIRTIRNVDVVIRSGHFMFDKSRRATLNAITRAVWDHLPDSQPG